MTRLLAALEWHLLINNPIRSIRSWYVTNYTVEATTENVVERYISAIDDYSDMLRKRSESIRLQNDLTEKYIKRMEEYRRNNHEQV